MNLWISGGETVTSVHQDHSENIMHMLAGPPAAFLPGTCVRTSDRPVPVLVRPLRPARAGEKEFLLFRPAEEANLHYESVRPPMYECLPRLAA